MQNVQQKFFTPIHKQANLNQVSFCSKPAFKSDYDQIEINQADEQPKNKKTSPGVIVGTVVAIAGALAIIYALTKGKPATAENIEKQVGNNIDKATHNTSEAAKNTACANIAAATVKDTIATNTSAEANTIRSNIIRILRHPRIIINELKEGFTDVQPIEAANAPIETFKGSVQLARIRKEGNICRAILKTPLKKPTTPITPPKRSPKKAGPKTNVFNLIQDLKIDSSTDWDNFSRTNSQMRRTIKVLPKEQQEEAYYSYYQKLHQQNIEILDRVLLGRTRRGLSNEELNAIERL